MRLHTDFEKLGLVARAEGRLYLPHVIFMEEVYFSNMNAVSPCRVFACEAVRPLVGPDWCLPTAASDELRWGLAVPSGLHFLAESQV